MSPGAIACDGMGFWTGNCVAERRRLSPRLLDCLLTQANDGGYRRVSLVIRSVSDGVTVLSIGDRNLWVNLWGGFLVLLL
ncbi:MAG: hypothetical protein HWQ38_01760 [Nostoc sp. NMS7]|uniref:hypothetical protein n=1 Tax=Nostoc sp. NMS7 TaxID=2815391 RepID=UPI0025DCE1E6|nr:hypothetical protein [Nostoc sp. NMS7]MBN3945270.1 hypothetical protein [Nostoc sp. NMS7]